MRRSVRGAALTAGSPRTAHASGPAGTTEVAYQGRTFAAPEACVRFGRNEQIESEDGLTVNAAHLTAAGGIDIVVASSATAAHNCA